jgi:hypothetical protein
VLAAIPMMRAVAEQQRRRLRTIASVTAAVLTVIGVTFAVVWRFDLLKRIF